MSIMLYKKLNDISKKFLVKHWYGQILFYDLEIALSIESAPTLIQYSSRDVRLSNHV